MAGHGHSGIVATKKPAKPSERPKGWPPGWNPGPHLLPAGLEVPDFDLAPRHAPRGVETIDD